MKKYTRNIVTSAILGVSVLGFSQDLHAATTATLSKDGAVVEEIESTNLAELGTGLESGHVITIYQDINSNAQFSGNAVGASGTVTIQSATPDTQYTITTNGQRFCDYAHGIYNLTDLCFYKCGNDWDGGGAFYRNDGAESTSTFNMDNVLFENCLGTNGAVLRAAAGMTLSGVYSFKNSAVHYVNEGAVYAHAGNVNFTGNQSVATFTGTTAGGDYQVYDVKASENINFTDTGTYTFGTGLTAKKLNINGSSVTLEAGSKSSFSDSVTVNSGTLTLKTEDFSSNSFTVGSEGTVLFKSTSYEPIKLMSDVTLDGGKICFETSAGSGDWNTLYAVDEGKIYVSANGGTLTITNMNRGFVQNGIHSVTGVNSGNLILNGSAFICGTSTFNGYFELTDGMNRFSNEAVASSKGIILNGGKLQYLGNDILENSTRSLSCTIYLKNNSSVQAGYYASFELNGSISDYDGADMTGKTLTVVSDSGTVNFNGDVNTKAILQLNDAVATNGTNNIVLGGLAGGDTFTNTAASTDKTLTLNVAESAPAEFTGTISGPFNLVKSGKGMQTFSTTGIGTNNSSLNSVTVSEGVLAMTNNAPIYAKTLTVGENGALQFGTGTYNVDVDTLELLGDVVLTFASAEDYTKLNITADSITEDTSSFLTFTTTDGYKLEQGVEYQIGNLPNLGVDFNYDSLLVDSYTYNLAYGNNGLVLSIDSSAVPEPTTWVMLLAGFAGLGVLTRKSRKG